jgi:hypothetical protein
MTSTLNPHFLSEMDATPTLQIRDDLDFPHSGIFKALHLAIKGTYVIKESATDFDITQTTSGGFTQLQVKGGAAFRQGAYVQIGSGSGTTTNITMNTSYNPGTGAVDVTPVASDVYLLMVATAANAIVLRGNNTVTNKLPEWADSDIPIAVIKVTASSADDATDRPIQYLTTDQDDSSLSIGYASSNNYVEAMSIVSDADGDVTIANKVSDKDLLFAVNDGGASTEVMRFDADVASVVINDGGLANVDFRIESDGEDEAFFLDAGANSLHINKGETAFETHIASTNDIVMSVTAAGVVFNEDGHATNDFRVESDTYDSILKIDAGANELTLGGHDAAKIGFYAASPVVTPVLAASTIAAGSPSPTVTQLDAKVLAISSALVTLGLCNVA